MLQITYARPIGTALASVQPCVHRHLLSNCWNIAHTNLIQHATFPGCKCVQYNYTEQNIKWNILNVNQFQSNIPRVGRWQIAQALVVNGMRLIVPLLCGMRVDSVRLADKFASMIYSWQIFIGVHVGALHRWQYLCDWGTHVKCNWGQQVAPPKHYTLVQCSLRSYT